MRRARSAPVTFRVYPARSRRGLYVLVRVFDRQLDMVRAVRAEDRRDGLRDVIESDTQGVMQSMTVMRCRGRRWRATPQLGIVNLHRRRLGVVVITHEFGHAMLAWAKRKRLPGTFAGREDMNVEERILHAQSEMLRQFMERAETLRLYS